MKGFRAVPLQPQTAEGAFFRVLPEKIPHGICTGASFLLTLQSLPLFRERAWHIDIMRRDE